MSPSPPRTQCPIVTRSELVEDGWNQGRLSRAVGRDLVRVMPGTYAVGSDPTIEPHDLLHAARPHFGPDVVAILGTAATLHGLPAPWPGDGAVHIARPPGREQHQQPGLRVHTWKLRAVDGGYPPDELQKEFVVAGQRYRTDLAWRRADGGWLAAEADGRSVHDVPEAILRDHSRSNALVASGEVDLVRFTWSDSVPRLLVPRVLATALGPPRTRQSRRS